MLQELFDLVENRVFPQAPAPTAARTAAPAASPVQLFEQADAAFTAAWLSVPENLRARVVAAAQARNAALADAKDHVKAFPGQTVGPFTVTKVPVSVDYDPNKLPEAVKARPGVLVADAKVIAALIKGKALAEADVAAARVESAGTPRVTGPKEVVLP